MSSSIIFQAYNTVHHVSTGEEQVRVAERGRRRVRRQPAAAVRRARRRRRLPARRATRGRRRRRRAARPLRQGHAVSLK